VGSNWRVNDGAVFRNLTLNSAMENNLLNWHDNSVKISDDALPLRNTLLKPYIQQGTSDLETKNIQLPPFTCKESF
jgi:hypothetical protein